MKQAINELFQYQELLLAFSAKEIKIRYKQTVLGFLWAILQPAALTAIFTLVFGLILKVNSSQIPYPVFAYSALLPWTFFNNAIGFGSLSVINNSGLVTKVYFPREIIPFSSIAAAFFDFAVASLIFILMMVYYKIPITTNIFYLAIIIPVFVILTTGISLFFSAINVLFRDIRFIIPICLQILMYLTPVIYSLEQVPQKYQWLIFLNPLSPLIEGFRDVSVLGKTPNIVHLIYSLLLSIIIFILGYWFFKRKEKVFADVI